jgi:hypothetical protein
MVSRATVYRVIQRAERARLAAVTGTWDPSGVDLTSASGEHFSTTPASPTPPACRHAVNATGHVIGVIEGIAHGLVVLAPAQDIPRP